MARADQFVADWIADHESRHSRDLRAQERAAWHLRRSVQLSVASTAIAAAATAWLVAAIVDKSMSRSLDHFVRLGGGLGGFVFLLLPILLPAGTAL